MDIEELKQRVVALEALVAALLAERRADHGMDHDSTHEAITDLAREHAVAQIGSEGVRLVDRISAIGSPMVQRLEPAD